MQKRSYWGTEGAGVLAVAEDTGRFLVALRAQDVVEPGTWGTIGGKHDYKDEDLEATALREFGEETGYQGQIELFPVLDYEDPGKFKYRNFIGVVPTESKEITKNGESDEIKWVTFEELLALDPKHPGLEILLDAASEALSEFARR
jgi:8-oxo-dGTP pyrophosphatase MutT (NUDIX family)